jgi:hypothetical protein
MQQNDQTTNQSSSHATIQNNNQSSNAINFL